MLKLSLTLYSGSTISDVSLFSIASRYPLLTHLDISNCSFISDKGTIEVLKNCKVLSTLNLACCKLTDAIVPWIQSSSVELVLLYGCDSISTDAKKTINNKEGTRT